MTKGGWTAEFQALFDQNYFGNPAWRWIVGGAVALGLLFILLLLRRLTRKQYARLAATPQEELLEIPLHVASRTTIWFLLIAAVSLGLQTLDLPAKATRVLLTIFTVAGFWQTGLWATTAVLATIEHKQRKALAVDRAAAGSLGIIAFIARLTIWSLVLLLTLSNLGIKIQPLLAGLGIGGIAVALAAQNILGDLFASLSITLDRPFVLGERRVVFTISVGPETPLPQLRKIAGLIRSLIEAFEKEGISFAYPAQRLYLEQQPAVQSQLIGK